MLFRSLRYFSSYHTNILKRRTDGQADWRTYDTIRYDRRV